MHNIKCGENQSVRRRKALPASYGRSGAHAEGNSALRTVTWKKNYLCASETMRLKLRWTRRKITVTDAPLSTSAPAAACCAGPRYATWISNTAVNALNLASTISLFAEFPPPRRSRLVNNGSPSPHSPIAYWCPHPPSSACCDCEKYLLFSSFNPSAPFGRRERLADCDAWKESSTMTKAIHGSPR